MWCWKVKSYRRGEIPVRQKNSLKCEPTAQRMVLCVFVYAFCESTFRGEIMNLHFPDIFLSVICISRSMDRQGLSLTASNLCGKCDGGGGCEKHDQPLSHPSFPCCRAVCMRVRSYTIESVSWRVSYPACERRVGSTF